MHYPTKKHWKTIGTKDHHGVCIPLFALHSGNSCGIGEFPDLIPMIDWCKRVGMDVIQLLPIYDTGDEISPYSPISFMAFNPLYLGISNLATNEDQHLIQSLQKLCRLQHIDYERVRVGKEKFLKRHFNRTFSSTSKTGQYKSFVRNNPWLKEYAQFKPSGSEDYHTFVQFLCYLQMRQVKKIADQKGVLLKGDVPILIAKNSVDVQSNPEMFDTSVSVGAPPDPYSASGQNWGFPCYRWDTQKKQILTWWKNRLQFQENFFHIYRIDHVVGLFRIWVIPKGKGASEGIFLPKSRKQWRIQGRSILESFLAATSMLPIAEDLGTVPKWVKSCLLEMEIPGTKVMRWETRRNGSYIPLKSYPKASMTTISTHDTETLEQWWYKCPDAARLFAERLGLSYTRKLSVQQREAILKASHQTDSYFHVNLLQEYFPLVPGMAWGTPDAERINRPGRNFRKNWRYRYRKSVEEITSNAFLARKIQEVITF